MVIKESFLWDTLNNFLIDTFAIWIKLIIYLWEMFLMTSSVTVYPPWTWLMNVSLSQETFIVKTIRVILIKMIYNFFAFRPTKQYRYCMSTEGNIYDVSEECRRKKDANLPDMICVVHVSFWCGGSSALLIYMTTAKCTSVLLLGNLLLRNN